jgi:hypothetical protein
MSTSKYFSENNEERVSQHELENAVETLSNVLYLIEYGGDGSHHRQACFEIAANALATLKKIARQGRQALKPQDRDGS